MTQFVVEFNKRTGEVEACYSTDTQRCSYPAETYWKAIKKATAHMAQGRSRRTVQNKIKLTVEV